MHSEVAAVAAASDAAVDDKLPNVATDTFRVEEKKDEREKKLESSGDASSVMMKSVSIIAQRSEVELEDLKKLCDLEQERRRIAEELIGAAKKQVEIESQRKKLMEKTNTKCVASPLRSRLQVPIGAASPDRRMGLQISPDRQTARKRPRPPDGPPSLRAFEEAWEIGYN